MIVPIERRFYGGNSNPPPPPPFPPQPFAKKKERKDTESVDTSVTSEAVIVMKEKPASGNKSRSKSSDLGRARHQER